MSSSPSSVWTLLPVEGMPAGRTVPNALSALASVAKHLRESSATGHKERVDLQVFNAHSGTNHHQVQSIPDAVYAELRGMHGVTPTLLKPCDGSSAAVVMFTDSYGALKGLPVNKRAGMVMSACGLSNKDIRGDCFIGRLSSGLELGFEFAPQAISDREWLEAAQAANKAGGNAAFSKKLVDWVEQASERVNHAIAAATGAEAQKAAAATAAVAKAVEAGTVSFTDGGDDVNVQVVVPAGTKGKQVVCTIKDTSLKVKVMTLPAGKTAVIDGTLFQEVNANDCTWHVEDPSPPLAGGMRQLVISLEKKKKMTWLMLTREGQA